MTSTARKAKTRSGAPRMVVIMAVGERGGLGGAGRSTKETGYSVNFMRRGW